MASISSVISIFVLLLATYCYSVPIGTFEYSTIHSEFPVEHHSIPLSSFEETTVFPHIHNKRTKDIHTGIDRESDEYTTEYSSLDGLKHQERTFEDETTSSMVERSYDNHRFDSSRKDSKFSRYGHQSPSKHSSFNDRQHYKRTFEDETTSSMTERSDDIHTFDDTTEEPTIPHHEYQSSDKREETATFDYFTTVEMPSEESKIIVHQDKSVPLQKREETDIFDFTTIEIPSEESKDERHIDTDLFTTFESSTEFNTRGSRFMQDEPTMTTFTEPTSSFETLADTTGLLHSRTVSKEFGHKVEGSSEEDLTTVKSDYWNGSWTRQAIWSAW